MDHNGVNYKKHYSSGPQMLIAQAAFKFLSENGELLKHS